MSHTVELLDGLPFPTVLCSMSEPFDTAKETPDSVNESNVILAGIEGDVVYLIIDLSQVNTTLGNLIQGLGAALLPHAELKSDQVFSSRTRLIMIGSNSLVKMASRAAGQDQYGNRHMEFFPTVDEALAFIRQAEKA